MKRRLPAIEDFIAHPCEQQEKNLFSLIERAKETDFGRLHDFKTIQNTADFKQQVPIQTYESLKPFIDRMLAGEPNVLWDGLVRWFAKSSGTSGDVSKFIPVSQATLDECHYLAARDVLAIQCRNYPNSQLFEGKGVILGGAHEVSELSDQVQFGDLSAVLIKNMSSMGRFFSSLDLETALMKKWEEKIERMVERSASQNVTNLSGVPSWMLIFLKKILEKTGKHTIAEVWPNLEVYIHGGVSFTPYKSQFEQIFGDIEVQFLETYNASEGFFALQDSKENEGLLLMLDMGIFFEFMPLEELGNAHPHTLGLDEVELATDYAILISTQSGLFRYLLGDTVRFTSLQPHRIIISGRTKHFINVFGEELMVHNTDEALAKACRATDSMVSDYTVAPIFMNEKSSSGGHEWLIEFEKTPADLALFTELLDKHLQAENSDYAAKRYKNMALRLPVLHVLPQGSFYDWMQKRGKLGGQNKVPRLFNSRKYLEEILGFVNEK